MADEWSTTVTDWQGVDSKPVTNSKNLITSGGVFPFTSFKYNNYRTSSDYSDLNDIPIGTITQFPSNSGILNTPTTWGGTLLCSCKNTTSTDGQFQLYISNSNDGGSKVYYRIKWNNNWSNWKTITTTSDINAILSNDIALKYNGSKSSSDYSNFNDVPIGTITTFANITGISNIPESKGGTLICTSRDSNVNVGGRIQLYITSVTNKLYYRIFWGNPAAWSDWVKVATYTDVQNLVNQSYISSCLSSFPRIGVIGDSYASGLVMNPSTPGHGTEYWFISWIQQIARKNGIVGINYSKSGVTCRTWLTTDICKDKLDSDDPCDLYYMVLGRNDRNQADVSGGQPLGTINDIHDDNPSLNADSFYGNYGKIVELVKSKAPNAKIIFSTMDANNDSRLIAYNSAIIEIAEHYSLPVIIQYNDAFFKSSYYTSNKIDSHPTVQLYGGMADAIERLTKSIIVDNAEYFNNIIPTRIN